MVFLWFSYGFPIKTSIFLWISHGFPMKTSIFPWISHGFPIISHGKPIPIPPKKTSHATVLLRALHAAVAAEGQRAPAAVRFDKKTQFDEVARRAVIPEKSGLYPLYMSTIYIYIHIYSISIIYRYICIHYISIIYPLYLYPLYIHYIRKRGCKIPHESGQIIGYVYIYIYG